MLGVRLHPPTAATVDLTLWLSAPQPDAVTVKRAAMVAGMDSLRDDGARKVLRGMTTVEEVLAATQEDVIVDE